MAKKKAAKKKSTGLSNSQKLGIGVGLTTAAVAAAGAYFLYGSEDAPKNRKRVKSGILRAKAEVLEALENAQEITEDEFQDLVEGVVASYSKVKSLSKKDLVDFKKEMKENWQDLLSSSATKVISVEKMAKKLTKKKPARKATKKVTKKKAVKKVAKKTIKKAVKKTTKGKK